MQQKIVAHDLGIREVETIRILTVLDMPRLEGPHLGEWAERHHFIPRMTAAYTFGHGIIVADAYADDPAILAHELVHVRQMEEMGLEGYFRRYLGELEQFGYQDSPLEIEAIEQGRKHQR